MNWKIYLTATIALFLVLKCEAKSNRKRRNAPVFELDGNLSFNDCGRSSPNAANIDEQFPWLVRILNNKISASKCFGVVISNDTVVTSAYCVDDDERPQKVLLVGHLTSQEGHQTAQKIIHEEYQLLNLDNNIAVLKFDHDLLQFGARPICLWNQGIESSGGSVAQNNGIGTFIGMKRGNTNFNLSKGEVKTRDPNECKNITSKRQHSMFGRGQICATFIDFNQSGCMGGFGAALQFEINGRWFLRGLLNSAAKVIDNTAPCYKSHVPSFTDTARHVKFITQNADISLKNALDVNDVAFKGQYSYSGCGRKFSTRRRRTVLSLGGQSADVSEVPWTVAIYTYKRQIYLFRCGGSLISKLHILTAAHCVFQDSGNVMPADELHIFLGKTSFKGDMTSEGGVISKLVESVIPYETYNRVTNEHDIALIKMKSPVQFSDTIATVCLWSGSADETFIAGKTGLMSGWGFVDLKANNAKKLQKLSLPILTKDQCKSISISYSPDYFKQRSQRQILCAGYENENKGPCNGDSGGPLTIQRDGRSFLRGLVSEGVSQADDVYCNPNFPTIFTDVALYRAWIKQKTGKELLNYDTTSRNF